MLHVNHNFTQHNLAIGYNFFFHILNQIPYPLYNMHRYIGC